MGASGSKAKGSSDAREAALKAELDVTSQSLAASKQEAEALSVGLQKANAFIEVSSLPCLILFKISIVTVKRVNQDLPL